MNIIKDYPQVIAAIIAGIFALICKLLELRSKNAVPNPSRGFSGWLIIIAATFAVVLSLYSVTASRSQLSIPHAEQGRTDFHELSGHVTFNTKFTETPQILVSLGHIDANGARFSVEVPYSDEHGFNYTISGKGDFIATADLIWLAVGK